MAGQFLDDGTLLKPVVVDTTVEDGRSQLRTYKVRAGDTLTGIAGRTGVSMMTIWWANKLKSKDDLRIGQMLVIPPVDGLVVTVKAGDTLASIAAARKVDAADIVATNGLTDETLVIGQVLIIPGARGKAIPTPKPTKRPVRPRRDRQPPARRRRTGGAHQRPPARASTPAAPSPGRSPAATSASTSTAAIRPSTSPPTTARPSRRRRPAP